MITMANQQKIQATSVEKKLDLKDTPSAFQDHFAPKEESDDDGSKPKVGKEASMAADENLAAVDNSSSGKSKATSGDETLDSNSASSAVIKETQTEAAEGNEDSLVNNLSENETSGDNDVNLDDDPLVVIAKECLQQGNKEYKQGDFHNALQLYTEGLQLNCKDYHVTAKLYSNRAAANFHLENFENSL